MDKIKIYDFDKTLVRGDSIGVFLRYAIKNGWIKKSKVISNIFIGVLKLIFTGNFLNLKNKVVELVESVSEENLKEFAKYLIETRGFDLINSIEEEGYITILCSASLYGYMKYVKDILGFTYLIATPHKDGKVIYKNNSKKAKEERLTALFKDQNIKVDYEKSKSFTDSYKNDKWMCSFTKNKYLVNSKKEVKGFINIYTS